MSDRAGECEMSAEIEIRRAGLDEIPIMVGLYEAYRRFYRVDSDPSRAGVFITDRMKNAESVIFLAYVDGKPVGFVQLYPKFSSVHLRRDWILNDLFVDPEYRRRGYARALMNASEQFARSTGAGVLTLKTERTNEAARTLYESRGWEQDEVFLTYVLGL